MTFSNPENPIPPLDSHAVPTLDIEQMRSTLGIDGPDGAGLIRLYLDTTTQNLVELAEAVRQGQAQQVERIAHSCAGANAMVGMNRLAQLLKKFEAQAQKIPLEQAMKLLAEVQNEFALIRDYLEKQNHGK